MIFFICASASHFGTMFNATKKVWDGEGKFIGIVLYWWMSIQYDNVLIATISLSMLTEGLIGSDDSIAVRKHELFQ